MNQLRFYGLLIALLFLYSCGSGDTSQSESFDDLPVTEENSEAQPVPLLVMTYSVESYETWSSVFEAEKSKRESFNLTDLGFLASAEDSRKISVILRSSDHRKAEEYVQSESLLESLQNMGVIGEPEIHYLNALQLPEKPVTQRYRMMISHEVKDYTHWKEIFDQHEAERLDSGLELIGIARETENENMVSVMFAFEDMNTARMFATSDELKEAMKESGVVSDPVLTYLEKPSAN